MYEMINQMQDIEELIIHQMNQYWFDIDRSIIHVNIPDALMAISTCYDGLPSLRYYQGGKARFSPYVSVTWMVF